MLGDWKKMLQGLKILAALTEGSIHSLLFTSGSTLPLITTALGGWCSLFSTGTHRLTVHRYIEIKTHQRGGRGVFFPPSEGTTKWTFLQLRSFNAVSHVVVTPNHKVIQLLHHNCNLINVMNHNAKLVRRTADMHPPWKDHWTPKLTCHNSQVEGHCFRHCSLPYFHFSVEKVNIYALSWDSVYFYFNQLLYY